MERAMRFIAMILCAGIASAQIVTIQGTDTISSSRTTINNNFSWLNTNKATTNHNHDALYPRLDGAYSDPDWLTLSIAKITGLTAALAAKQDAGSYEPAISAGTTGQWFRWDKTWATLNTDAVPETATNQYFTNARAIAALNWSNLSGKPLLTGSGARLATAPSTVPSDGCAYWSGGDILSTGLACGSGGGGEANTASNQGSAGVGVFYTKSGVDLQFYKLNPASNKISITLDATNHKIDFDINPANLGLQAALGFTPLNPANNLSELVDAAVARSNLGLGTAATQPSTAFAASNASTTVNGQPCQLGSTCTVADSTKVPTTRQVNGHALSADVTVTASDVGAVPATRTINGYDLSANRTLTAADVSAVPTTRTVNGKALSSNISLTPADIGAEPTDSSIVRSSGTKTQNAITVYDSTGKLIATGCTIDSNNVLNCGTGTSASAIILPELTANGSDDFRIYGLEDQSSSGCIAVSGQPTTGNTWVDSGTPATLHDPDGGTHTCRVMVWQAPAGGVSSVYGRTGSVVAASGDYTAAQVTNTPAGNIAAITVQAALNELDTEKAPSSHTHTKSQITDLETITTTPTASAVPKADGTGKIASGWIPTLNQNTTGTAAGLSAQYIDWSAGSGPTSIANKPAIPTITGSAVLKGSSGNAVAAGYADVVNLWTSCSSGYLKYNGTCDSGSAFSPAYTSVTFSATPTFTVSSHVQGFTINLTGNITSSTLSGATAGDLLMFKLCQDATGGRTVVYPTGFSLAPTVLPLASACTSFSGTWDGSALVNVVSTSDGSVSMAPTTTAPGSSPGSGNIYIWYDSTANTQQTRDSSGNIASMVRTAGTGTSNQWVDYIGANSVPHTSQPTFANIGGTASASQIPTALSSTTSVNGTSIPASATLATTGANTFTGRQDASGAASTAPIKTGTSLPGTCTIGDLYFKSDATPGQNIYECASTNTWTQQLNSGGGGGLTDPGANGPIKRTALNTTAPATFSDLVALWASGSCSGYLKSDGSCDSPSGTGVADPGANGIMARTAANVSAARTITGTASHITVSNGDGVSGNPTLDLDTAAKTWSKSFTLLDPVTTDTGRVQFVLPYTGTITWVGCSVTGGTSMTINLDKRAFSTPGTTGTSVLSAGLVCDTNGQTSCASGCDANTISSSSVSSRAPVALTISAASGTNTELRVYVEGTY